MNWPPPLGVMLQNCFHLCFCMFWEQYFFAIPNPAVQIQELGKHPNVWGWTSYTHTVSILCNSFSLLLVSVTVTLLHPSVPLPGTPQSHQPRDFLLNPATVTNTEVQFWEGAHVLPLLCVCSKQVARGMGSWCCHTGRSRASLSMLQHMLTATLSPATCRSLAGYTPALDSLTFSTLMPLLHRNTVPEKPASINFHILHVFCCIVFSRLSFTVRLCFKVNLYA